MEYAGIVMRRILKIILAIFAMLIIIVAVFGAIFFLDLVAYTATGAQILTPTGTSMGNASVLYDPGLSGASTRVAEKVAANLQAQNLTVTLAGIKSSAAANTTGYNIIVIGGPIYAGAPTSSIKDALNTLNPDAGAKVGVFGSGSGASAPEDITMIRDAVPTLSNGSLSDAIVVKIGSNEDLDARASDFVTELLS